MKTYVLIISKKYPTNHIEAGSNTEFYSKIIIGDKIHTIRQNYDLWKKRFQKIDKGEACLSIRQWTGKPYRSKQKELFKLTIEDGIGIEQYNFDKENCYESNLPENDGLTKESFLSWFEKVEQSQKLAIIHFTPFRYSNS